jgi:AcrR family transcriptional regulator
VCDRYPQLMSAHDPSASPARVGRRPGTASTRQAVLQAARARFAGDGFAATTIRRVAADAGVDPSQVMQFFGSKDELFATVMEIPPSALHRFATAFEGPDEHLGERVVRAYLEAWDGAAEESEPLMAMLRGAIVNQPASTQLRDFIQSRLVHGMDGRGDDAMLRAGLAAAMLVGVITSRRIIGVPILVAADTDTLVKTLGPAIQQLLSSDQQAATA